MSKFQDSAWILLAHPSPNDDWHIVRAYALRSDLDADESMLRRLLPDWEFDAREVEYVG